MRSIMSHQFSQVPRAEIPRSSFNRSSGLKTAFDAGYLIPVFLDDVIPGDTFNLNMTAFCRLATPLRPFMDNVFINSFFFFVPLRLVWTNFTRFMGEQPNPGDSTDFIVPYVTSPTGTGYAVNSLQDYFGIPPLVGDLGHHVLPLRAYNLIWNEWFRDQNLQNRVPVNLGDTGSDAYSDFTLLRRGKRHDYFSSALPWPQKGPSVTIPIADNIPVTAIANGAPAFVGWPANGVPTKLATDATGQVYIGGGNNSSELFWDPVTPSNTGLEVAGTALATTINELRQAFQVQKLHERDARGGTRYIEIVLAHFNVQSPDARLQRPEYLGGGQGVVNLHQVPQQSATPETGTPQGNLAAYGTSMLSGHGFTHSFTEHGYIIGLISVRADLNYQQGLNRMWKRNTKYDYYWPALSMIGEQAILNSEIFAQGFGGADPDIDDAVFGYQERFAEYRYKPSMITGEMRSAAPQSLDTWHLAQDFATLPSLNAAFIEDNPPMGRVLAVPTERHFIGDFYFQLRCARPMPVYGVPGLIDHF